MQYKAMGYIHTGLVEHIKLLFNIHNIILLINMLVFNLCTANIMLIYIKRNMN